MSMSMTVVSLLLNLLCLVVLTTGFLFSHTYNGWLTKNHYNFKEGFGSIKSSNDPSHKRIFTYLAQDGTTRGHSSQSYSTKDNPLFNSVTKLESTNLNSSRNSTRNFINILSNLASSGVKQRDLRDSGIWDQVEQKLKHIKLHNPTEQEKSDDTNSVSLVELMSVLANLQLTWDRIPGELKISIDNEMQKFLTSTENYPYKRFPEFMVYLANLKREYKEFQPNIKISLKKSILIMLKSSLSNKIVTLPALLTAISRLGIHQSEWTSSELSQLKSSFRELFPHIRRPQFWRIFHSLSEMEFKWSHFDISIRQSLENSLKLYNNIQSWQFTPKEIFMIIQSLSKLSTNWNDLHSFSQIGLLIAFENSMEQMTPREFASSLHGLSTIGLTIHSFENDIVMKVIRMVTIHIELMSNWDIVQCINGLGQLGLCWDVLPPEIYDTIAKKSLSFGPTLSTQLIHGVGLLCSNSHSDTHCSSSDSQPARMSLTRVLDVFPEMSKKWASRMTPGNIMDLVKGLASIHSQSPLLQSFEGTEMRHNHPGQFQVLSAAQEGDSDERGTYLEDGEFWRAFARSREVSRTSLTVMDLFQKKEKPATERERVDKGTGGSRSSSTPLTTSSTATFGNIKDSALIPDLPTIDYADMGIYLHKLGCHGVTDRILFRSPAVQGWLQNRVQDVLQDCLVAYGATPLQTSSEALESPMSLTSKRNMFPLETKELEYISRILSGFVSMEVSWDSPFLTDTMRASIWSHLMAVLDKYTAIKFRKGLLFEIPLEEDAERRAMNILFDQTFWALACMDAPLSKLDSLQTRRIISAIQQRLEEADSPRTISSMLLALSGLGSMLTKGDQADEMLLTTSMNALLKVLQKDMNPDDFVGMTIAMNTWNLSFSELNSPMRSALMQRMDTFISDSVATKINDKATIENHLSRFCYCVVSFGEIGGLSFQSPRQGDRLLVHLSRHADELSIQSIVRILPVIHQTSTTNRRTLSYLCHRLATVALSKAEDSNTIAVDQFLSILSSLRNLQNQKRATEEMVVVPKDYMNDKELRYLIISQAGILFRALQPSELVEMLRLLSALGIRWSELSMPRHAACLQALIDVRTLLTMEEEQSIKNSLLEMGLSDSKLTYFLQPKEIISESPYDAVNRNMSDVWVHRISSLIQEEESIMKQKAAEFVEVLTSFPSTDISSAITNETSNISKVVSVSGDVIASKDSESPRKWSSLEDLRQIFHTIKPINLANTLYYCASPGTELKQLQASGLWGLFDEKIGSTIHEWAHQHAKLSMLFNAFSKLHINQDNLSSYTRKQILVNCCAQLPHMSPRAVSNILYYMARAQWRIYSSEDSRSLLGHEGKSFRQSAIEALIRTCPQMSSTGGEFCNGIWAAGEALGLKWYQLHKTDQLILTNAIETRESSYNDRDVATILNSFRAFRVDWKQLPMSTKRMLNNKIIEVVSKISTQDLSILLYSLGSIRAPWSDISSICRFAIRDRIVTVANELRPRELAGIITGLAEMRLNWNKNTFNIKQKDLIYTMLSKYFGMSVYEYSSINSYLRAFYLLDLKYSDMSEDLRTSLLNHVGKIVNGTTADATSLERSYDIISRLGKLGFTWQEIRSSPTAMNSALSNLVTTTMRLKSVDIKTNTTLSSIFRSLENIGVRLTSKRSSTSTLPKPYINHIVSSSLHFAKSHPDKSLWIISKLRSGGIEWSSFTMATRTQLFTLLAILSNLMKNKKFDYKANYYFILKELHEMNITWSECKVDFQQDVMGWIDAYFEQKVGASNIALDKESSPLAVSLQRMRDNIIHNSTGETSDTKFSIATTASSQIIRFRSNSHILPLNTQSLVDTSDSELRIIPSRIPRTPASNKMTIAIEELNRKLKIISDPDFLKAIFLLGQKKIHGITVLSPESLHIADKRLMKMSSELSLGAIVAVLTSLSRLGVDPALLPLSFPGLLTALSASASALDSRTFTAALRSLSLLGFQWSMFTTDQRMGLTAGVARVIVTSPHRLGTLLSILYTLGVTWPYLHEKINVVLRSAIYKIFADLHITYNSDAFTQLLSPSTPTINFEYSIDVVPVESELVSNHIENAFEVLYFLNQMEGSWELLGERTSLCVLRSCLQVIYSRQMKNTQSNIFKMFCTFLSDEILEKLTDSERIRLKSLLVDNN